MSCAKRTELGEGTDNKQRETADHARFVLAKALEEAFDAFLYQMEEHEGGVEIIGSHELAIEVQPARRGSKRGSINMSAAGRTYRVDSPQ